MKIKTSKATQMQTEFSNTLKLVNFVTQRKKFTWGGCMHLQPFCSQQNQLFQPYFSCKFESNLCTVVSSPYTGNINMLSTLFSSNQETDSAFSFQQSDMFSAPLDKKHMCFLTTQTSSERCQRTLFTEQFY